jgi:putative flippase GtrA
MRCAEWRLIVKFFVVGGAATLLYLAVASGLTYALGMAPALASGLAVAASIAFSYVGHNYFSFSVRGQHALRLPRFVTGSFALCLLSSLISYVSVDVAGHKPYVAFAAVCLLYPPASFLLNRYWVFRNVSSSQMMQPAADLFLPAAIVVIGCAIAAFAGGAYWLFTQQLHEPFAVRLLYRFGDADYLPLIYAIAHGNFREFGAYGLVGTSIIPFPLVSSLPYSLAVAAFGDRGFVMMDIAISIARFALCVLLAGLLVRCKFQQACAALVIFVLTGPALVSHVLPRVQALGWNTSAFGPSWLMRYPRSYVTGLFLLLLLLTGAHLTKALRRREKAPRFFAAHGVALAVTAQGDLHLAMIACLATGIIYLHLLATNFSCRKAIAVTALQVAFAFSIAALPMVVQTLSASADLSVRWGLFPIPRSSVLLFVSRDKVALALVFGAAIAWLIARRYLDERAEACTFAAVSLYAASVMALPVSVLLIGKGIQIYHFVDRSRALAVVVLLVILFAGFGAAVRKLGHARVVLRALQAVLLLAATTCAAWQIRSSAQLAGDAAFIGIQQRTWQGWEPLVSYKTDFGALIDELQRPEYRGARVIGTFDQQLAMWWLTRRDHTLWIPDTFLSTAADAIIEKRSLQFARLIGMPEHTFDHLISQPESYFNNRFLTLAKWQASRAYTAAPIGEYSDEQRNGIGYTSIYDPWVLRLPGRERDRLLRNFRTTDAGVPPIDLIVLTDTASFGRLPGPPAEYFAPVFSNDSFRVWIRR